MYIQFKQGFLEIDQWDGTAVPVKAHQAYITKLRKEGDDIFVIRTREASTAKEVADITRGKVFVSPAEWDYEFRIYVQAERLKYLMVVIIENIDYRNFKNWCHDNKPDNHPQTELAHDIWSKAFYRLAGRPLIK